MRGCPNLIEVLVEAGILKPTEFGGYEVAADVQALQKEVEMLRRQVDALLKKKQ